jgi:hypothetical protein
MTAWVIIPGDENTRPTRLAKQCCLDKLLILPGRGCIVVRNQAAAVMTFSFARTG